MCVCAYVLWVCSCNHEYVDVGGQLAGVSSQFSPSTMWGFRELNSGHHVWWQVPLPAQQS